MQLTRSLGDQLPLLLARLIICPHRPAIQGTTMIARSSVETRNGHNANMTWKEVGVGIR